MLRICKNDRINEKKEFTSQGKEFLDKKKLFFHAYVWRNVKEKDMLLQEIFFPKEKGFNFFEIFQKKRKENYFDQPLSLVVKKENVEERENLQRTFSY